MRGNRLALLGNQQRIRWLLLDNFNPPDLPAGSVNGTLSDSGHVRTVVDTNNKLSIAGGNFSAATGAVAYDSLQYGAYTRLAGQMLIAEVVADIGSAAGELQVQWGIAPGGAVHRMTLAGGSLYFAGSFIVGAYTNDLSYKHCLVQRGTGFHYFILGGTQYPNWIFLYSSVTSNTDNLKPAFVIRNADTAFTSSFLRIPLDLYLPVPLLSMNGAAYPVSNGLGHAEGVAGGLGSGGSGLTLLDAGTWAADGTYLANTPVVGVEKVSNGAMETGDPPTGWTGSGATVDGAADERTGGGGAQSISVTNSGAVAGAATREVYDAPSALGKWYVVNGYGKVITAGAIARMGLYTTSFQYNQSITAVNWTAFPTGIFRSTHTQISAFLYSNRATAGDEVRFDDISVKPLPISTLISNVQLATTDVLAEAVIHAYTLGSQVGIVQSDRPFAFAANANAAAGQKVIVLKGLTNAVPDTDTITIKHPIAGGTTYTIASVGALAGGIQTITLDDNLVEAVSANDMVGVDWASWNGTLTYYDGAGNIKLDEIAAGVYTNRGSTAKAFAADTRLIVRKIGSEYRVFAQEALIGSAITTVAAGAMVGKYWGLFSTLPANQITSTVVHDTGNVTNAHGILDKYSRD